VTATGQHAAARAGGGAVDRVAAVLERHTGMRVQSAQRHRLERAMASRMRTLAEGDHARYADRVEREANEWRLLIPDVAVGETHFFRDGERWEAIEREVIPDLLARRRGRLLRFWSAGCATGQEAYGLAMVSDRLRDRYPGLKVDVLGSDINVEALEVARRAEYPEAAMRGLSAADRLRFFEPRDGACRVRPAIQAEVRFEEVNLLAWAGRPHPGPGYDLILCQRVLIYLSPPATERVLAALADALGPGGVLLTGHTEAITAPAGCTLEWLGGSPAFRRMTRDAPGTRPAPAPKAQHAPREGEEEAPADPAGRLHRAWEAAIAERYAEAESHLSGLVRTGEALRLTAWIRLAAGDSKAAAGLIRTALAEGPTHPESHFLAGMLALAQGRPEEAPSHLKRALYLDPGFAPAHFHLAALLAAEGRADEARRAWLGAERASGGDAERIRRYVGFDAAVFAQVGRRRRAGGESGSG
jgi:chemotaxis protein methyltransferase CheR